MKNFLLTVVVLVLLASPAFAQSSTSLWVEGQIISSDGEISPWTNSLVSRKFDEKLGMFVLSQNGERWAQAYVGPTYSPSSWLQVGAGLGIEQADNPVRLGSFVWMGRGRYSLLSIYEDGGSGHWYKSELNIKAAGWLGAGAIVQHMLGVGPRVELNIPRTPVMVWGAPLYDWSMDRFNGMLAVRVRF
ncbi:MAG: hypothetical protein HYT66_00515 [Candidatus Yanofskybacteria bacterium]|nr:hypothetical protein [Candidatus Yanofskybacteria bacterium]